MSTLAVGTIKSATTSPPTVQNSAGTEIGTFCRAWVNFNGTGTVAIRSSFNVSSITDNGTGRYTVNFTTAMPNTNYAAICNSACISVAQAPIGTTGSGTQAPTYNTGSVSFLNINGSGTAADFDFNQVAVFSA